MEIQKLNFLKHLFRYKRNVYLDNNATTDISRNVRSKMNYVLKNCHGNPSSIYGIARKSTEIIAEARQHLADAIHADPQEIYFTGCATESNNSVLKSLCSSFYPIMNKIISTPIEHPSVINTLEFLKKQGIIIEYCPVDNHGHVLIDELEKMIDDNTFLICCMLANNEIGTIQDIKAITKIAHRHDVLVMSDCVQAFGKIPVDVHSLGIDYASFSAHKLHGPKGIGALYVRHGSPFSPLLHGGHQENGMRAGTESVHNIAGFGAACQNVNNILDHAKHIELLKCKFIQQLMNIKPDCIINSPNVNCLPNTVSITFSGISNAEFMAMLDYYGVAVSAASACSSQEEKSSSTLKAVGLSDQAIKETIRISLGTHTSFRDIRYAIKVINNYLKGKKLFINLISPARLDDSILFNELYYILDVRPDFMRNVVKSLPNSHELSFVSSEKYLNQIPADKHILVACQHGNLSHIEAYYLKSKGFRHVSSLKGGICAWKKLHSDLYEKYGGKNVSFLTQSSLTE